MFDKILIANRGEIACRVISTARRLGVRTVAVYSDADADAAHVAMANQAVRLGPAAVAESYLKGDAIIAAALATGAQAIHPGYGFLSENPDFVDAVTAAGLVFIGPPADAIRAMGLKDAAKALMVDTGVPVVPGYHGADQDADHLRAQADAIGYPVLIKARAGGGGKGMRLVERAADFAEGLQGAQREGQNSFGDPAVLVEKYITAPRHVEIQVFADAHGNVVHLFERDCSLQRRHQKVIEEAPAPDMPADVRAAMGDAAVEAARAIGYQGAGTVEFIADGSDGLKIDGFWFMEMNTRLQVEHPVSEAITGLDLVEWQLRVAAGEPLGFAQDDLTIDGHAFEARLYAEDVARGFLPATGTLTHLQFPDHAAFGAGAVRIDSGVRAGDTISPWYDPMIAKVIVHGPDRATALQMLTAALDATQIAGTVTNLAFLSALTRHDGFAVGQVDTGLIGRDIDTLTQAPHPLPHADVVAALALSGLLDPPDGCDPWDTTRHFRVWGPSSLHVVLRQAEDDVPVALQIDGPTITTADGAHLTVQRIADGVRVTSDGQSTRLGLAVDGDRATVFGPGQAMTFTTVDPVAAAGAVLGGDVVLAPMPGLVAQVLAQAGQTVAAGDALIVLEAMKMEHTLRAPRDGQIADVPVTVGQQVDDGDVLVALEQELEA